MSSSGLSPVGSSMVSSDRCAGSGRQQRAATDARTPCVQRRRDNGAGGAAGARHSVHSTSTGGSSQSNRSRSSHANRDHAASAPANRSLAMIDDSLDGSLERLDESACFSQIDVEDMLRNGVPDHEILACFLRDLNLHDDYLALFLQTGYDMQTLLRSTPEDLTAVGVGKPNHRRRLINELHRLSAQGVFEDKWPLAVNKGPNGLRDWLRALNLSEYCRLLEAQGYADVWRDIVPLTWEDWEDVGVKRLGHLKKLGVAVRKLKENRHKQPMRQQSLTENRQQEPATSNNSNYSNHADYNSLGRHARLCITTQAVIHEEQATPTTSQHQSTTLPHSSNLDYHVQHQTCQQQVNFARLRPTTSANENSLEENHNQNQGQNRLVKMQLCSPARLLQEQQAALAAQSQPQVQPLSPRNLAKCQQRSAESDEGHSSDGNCSGGESVPPPLERLVCERSIEQLRHLRVAQSSNANANANSGANAMGDMLAQLSDQLDAMLTVENRAEQQQQRANATVKRTDV